jgi:RNA polymerase sigma factor (sigma-70 family)
MTSLRNRRGAGKDEIARVYRTRFRAFLFTLTALLGDADLAFDALQEGFLRAVRERRHFRGDSPVEAWIWRIVLNTARDDRRRRERARRLPVEPAMSGDASDGDPDAGDLIALLRSLPERQRLVIFLRYYADLSYVEIADVLGVAPGTVSAALHAAHRTLHRRVVEVRR